MGLPSEQLVLHPGVIERNGCLHDVATRCSVAYDRKGAGPGGRDDIIIAYRLGHFEIGRRQVPELLRAAVRTGPSRPFRVVGRSFRRRHPVTAIAVIREGTAAAALPVAMISLVFLAIGGAVAILVGGVAAILLSVVSGTVVCASSLIAHESAHLLAVRFMERDRTVGAVEHSWLNVWIVAPALHGWSRRCTALSGPVAGLAVAAAAALFGAPSWICLCVGSIHALNLLPSAPDGRLLFGRDATS